MEKSIGASPRQTAFPAVALYVLVNCNYDTWRWSRIKGLFGLGGGDGVEWNGKDGGNGPLFVLVKIEWNPMVSDGSRSIMFHCFPLNLFPPNLGGKEWNKNWSPNKIIKILYYPSATAPQLHVFILLLLLYDFLKDSPLCWIPIELQWTFCSHSQITGSLTILSQ